MLARLNHFKRYSPKKLEVIEGKKEILTDAERFYDCRNKVIETFKDRFFLFKMGFKKKKEPDIPDWVSVDRTTFNQIKNKIKKVNDKNIYVSPNCGFYISADH